MKKWIILVVVLIIAAVSWFSYTSKRKQALNVIGEDTANLAAMTKLITDQGLGLNANITKVSYDDLVKRAGEDLANHTGLFDVILQYPLSISTYAQNDWIVPFDEYAGISKDYEVLKKESDDIFTNVWMEIGFYGQGRNSVKAYGVPFAANTMLVCYNRRLLEDSTFQKEYRDKFHESLTAPKTWQQFFKIAEFFSAHDGYYGVSMEGADYWIAWEWSNIAFSYGGGVMRKSFGWQTPPNSELLV